VRVVRPVIRTVAETVAVSGAVRGQEEAEVGAEVGGRVGAILAREGDVVRRGQVIARLDAAVLLSEVRAAENQVRTALAQVAQAADQTATARAQLTQASRPALAADIARARADATQAEDVAQAELAAARQRLAERMRGDTPEERAQVDAEAARARAELEKAQKDLERQRFLVGEGASAAQNLDEAVAAEKTARAELENRLARQRAQAVGTRAEQIAQARAQVRSAEATLAGARASGRQQVLALLALPRPEDVAVARRRLAEAEQNESVAAARLREAQGALATARRRLEQAAVTAPFDGTVTQVLTEAGAVTGPSQPVVRLVRTARPEIRADVDETQLGRLRAGQDAVVSSDAYPGRAFPARVRQVGPQVDSSKGQVEVRLDPLRVPDWLRPGQTLSVNIVVERAAPRLVVPFGAVATAGGVSTVLVVDDGGVVRKRQVTAEAAGPEGVPVTAGLSERDSVVADPSGVAVGKRVRPESAGVGEGDR
jgi:RND family efflux transporter MFP subunit